MCILQLREDGELCEVVRRHRRDVNSSHNSRIGPHTSAHVPTHAAARMLSIEVSPIPPRFTGNRACRRARSRCASEPDSDPTILWKAAAMILSCSRAASMVKDGGMVRRKSTRGLYCCRIEVV